MSVPAWILDIFAAIMLAVSAVSAARLVAARSWTRPAADADADIDVAHVLMGVAMAGMLAAGLKTLPAGVWIAVFAVVTAWFAWRVAGEVRGGRAAGLRSSHHLPHLVHGAAMVYMFAAVSAPAAAGGGMAGMAMAGGAGGMGTLAVPTLALAFAVVMAAFAVTDLDLASGPAVGVRQVFAAASVPSLATVGAGSGGQASLPALATSAASRPAGHTEGPGLLDDRVTLGCRIAMGVTMALMLMLMI